MYLKTAPLSVLYRRLTQGVITFWVGTALLMMPLLAFANAPPPPPMTWFDFQDWPEAIEAVQVVECALEECKNPQLFAQYGRCTLSGCVTASREDAIPSETIVQLTCWGKTCLMAEEADATVWKPDRDFQLRVQSADRLWLSPVVTQPQQLEQSWQVSRLGSSLQIDFINAWERQGPPALFWGQGFLMTLFTEAVVLALLLKLMGKEPTVWYRTFVSFGLMHLVTYPLIWALPLGLMPFQARINRFFSAGALLIAFFYFVILFSVRKMASWKLVLGSLLVLPCAFIAATLTALLFSYGQPVPFTMGIPYGSALGITEGIITLLEAGFLTLLSRGMLPFPRAGLISVLMNGTSLLMGVALWQLWS